MRSTTFRVQLLRCRIVRWVAFQCLTGDRWARRGGYDGFLRMVWSWRHYISTTLWLMDNDTSWASGGWKHSVIVRLRWSCIRVSVDLPVWKETNLGAFWIPRGDVWKNSPSLSAGHLENEGFPGCHFQVKHVKLWGGYLQRETKNFKQNLQAALQQLAPWLQKAMFFLGGFWGHEMEQTPRWSAGVSWGVCFLLKSSAGNFKIQSPIFFLKFPRLSRQKVPSIKIRLIHFSSC